MDTKFKVGFNGANLEASYDGNSDGEASLVLKAMLGEALDELNSKGVAEVEVKKLRFVKNGSKVAIELDPNQDGEAVLTVEFDLGEAIDEAF